MTADPDATGSISAIVPVYNEAEHLRDWLEELHAHLTATGRDFEIVVVESGSTDASGALCDAIASERPAMRVVHEGARRGFGSALRVGFAHATKDIVWIVPADLPYPLDALERGLEMIRKADVVLSYRAADHRGAFRRIQSLVFNGAVRVALGLRVRSINSAFKLYRREVIARCRLRERGWLIDAEILTELARQRARIREMPVPLVERRAGGRSSVRLRDAAIVLGQLLRLRFRRA